MCQAYVCMCKVLMHIYFYSHLHATLGAFYVHFVVNIIISKRYKSYTYMSIRALVLYTCTCSHSLNYVLIGSISCCVLMHLFNILITLIFLIIFKEFVDIELFLVSRKVEESLLRREIGPCLAWCYENKSKLRKFKVDVLYFSLKKNCKFVNCFFRRISAVFPDSIFCVHICHECNHHSDKEIALYIKPELHV